MSSEQLNGLYQELIMDHARTPHAKVAGAEGAAGLASWPLQSHQLNPTCGDEITYAVRVEDGAVAEVRWNGHGCAISQASASLLSTLIEGMPVAEVRILTEEFREVMRARGRLELDEERFGDAVALDGVARYVARVKCAMLGWVAAERALASV